MWADASITSDLEKLSPSCSGETTSDRPIAVHGILSHHRVGLCFLLMTFLCQWSQLEDLKQTIKGAPSQDTWVSFPCYRKLWKVTAYQSRDKAMEEEFHSDSESWKACRLFLYSLRKSLNHKLLKALGALQGNNSGGLCHYILPSFLVTGCWFGWAFVSVLPFFGSYVLAFTISTSRDFLMRFV